MISVLGKTRGSSEPLGHKITSIARPFGGAENASVAAAALVLDKLYGVAPGVLSLTGWPGPGSVHRMGMRLNRRAGTEPGMSLSLRERSRELFRREA